MGTISLGATQIKVAERAGTVLVPFVRAGDLSATESVRFYTVNDTAVAGADYVATTETVTFQPGEASKLASIAILNDTLGEGNENFSVQILSLVGAKFGFPRTANVIILDDETPSELDPDPPTIAITSKTVAVSGLEAPTAFAWVPGQPETMVIAEKSGVIRVAVNGTLRGTPLLDLSPTVNEVLDRGLLDIELHPQFATQPYLYAYFTVDPADTAANPRGSNTGPEGQTNRYVHLMRFTVDTVAGELQVRPGSGVVLLGGAGRSLADISGGGHVNNEESFFQPASGVRPDGSYVDDYIVSDALSHSAGDMEFGPDGALYVSVGDGTYANTADPRTGRVQDLGSLSGKVLRVDTLTGDGLPDNPFFVPGMPDTNQSKVYQLGLRNSYRMAFDGDGDLFLGDVGWASWEEINTGGPGANFGWPYYEGGQGGVNLKTPTYQDLPKAVAFYNSGKTITAPFQAFSHLEADPGIYMQVLTMGDFYSGNQYPEALRGSLIFAELNSGRVFALDPNDPARAVTQLGTQDAFIVAMGQGPDGAIYYADYGTGTINKLQIGVVQTPVSGLLTVGAGPDALVLRVQQDAYESAAQYTVSIDGVQVGGTLAASATRVSGQFDAVVVRGNLAVGSHTATIKFLNDAYGGSGGDRNLFVRDATHNGDTVAFRPKEMYANGLASFDFWDDTAPQVIRPGKTTVVGAGSDTLVLRLQQDAHLGDAQYNVKVDGVQIGGTLTAGADRASGTFDTLTIRGDFAAGTRRAEVTFLNDAYAGTPDTDRNLFVASATYNGVAVASGARELLSAGPVSIAVQDATPLPNTVGVGSDALVLKLQQGAWLGSAQYTIGIDGVQVGGTFTASAAHLSGQFDTVTVRGDFAPGPHRATINFLNDAYGGTQDTDRNLFLISSAYNGDTIAFGARDLLRTGPAFIDFQDATLVPTLGVAITVGAGADEPVLQLQQEAYLGPAQYTISIDGAQAGGVLTASATRVAGVFDVSTVRGDFAAGDHTATANFLNDAYAGTPETDRNLFVTGGAYNGSALASVTRDLYSSGPASLVFTDAARV